VQTPILTLSAHDGRKPVPTFRERHGSSVRGLPYALRVAFTVVLLLPGSFFLLATFTTAGEWKALTLAITVLFGVLPAYLVLPSVWERSEESVRDEWRANRLERRLDVELGTVERAPLQSLHEREQPPSRW
jgi:hypothetical protein